MKLIQKILFFAALPASFALVGCDNVEEGPGRYEQKDRIESDRRVLILEFTGQQCPNCPAGAQTIQSIHDAYPENLVAVSIHPFNHILTEPVGNDLGLRSEEATVLFDYYHPEAFPCAIFNGTTMELSTGSWNKIFRQELIKTPEADITLEPSFDETTRKLEVSYSVEYLNNISEETNVQIWITESGIVGPQFNNSTPPIIVDYVNNHVLRVTLTGEWGESLGSNRKNGEVSHGKVSYDLPEEWNVSECHIVGFVQKASDKYVLQAAQTPIIESEVQE